MNLAKYAEAGLLKSEPYVKRSHHPSSAGGRLRGKYVGKCRRAQWYQWKNIPPSDPPSSVARYKMDMGRPIQQWFLGLCAKGGLKLLSDGGGTEWKDKSVPIPGCLEAMSASYDDIAQDPEGNLVGIEIKSTGQYGLKMIREGGPKEDHIMQICAYMRATSINHWMLVYVEREPGRECASVSDMTEQFDIYQTDLGFSIARADGSLSRTYGKDEVWDSVVNGWKSVEAAFRGQRMPGRDYALAFTKNGTISRACSDWQCQYCDFKSICWEKQL